MIEGTYTDQQLKQFSQTYFEVLEQSREGFLRLRDMMVQSVDLYLKNPSDETLQMIASLFARHQKHDIMSLISEVWRLRRLVTIIQTEHEAGFYLFSSHISDCNELLCHLNRCIFSLRRIEMGADDEAAFVQEGIDWLIEHQISPIAVSMICEEEVFVRKDKIYQRLCQEYEKNEMTMYAQIMQAICRESEKSLDGREAV